MLRLDKFVETLLAMSTTGYAIAFLLSTQMRHQIACRSDRLQ
ncbi:hypothetical protein [Nostoc sp.]